MMSTVFKIWDEAEGCLSAKRFGHLTKVLGWLVKPLRPPVEPLGWLAKPLGPPVEPFGWLVKSLWSPVKAFGWLAKPLWSPVKAFGWLAKPLGPPVKPLGSFFQQNALFFKKRGFRKINFLLACFVSDLRT